MGEGSSEGGQIGSGNDELGNNGMGVLGYKKVVVTGLVISAATVLVPPLVMGFALWGPACAVLLGSYAFTRRVLSFLLPVPPGHIYGHDDDDADDDDHEVEIEFEADPDVSKITLDDQKPAGLDEDTSGDLTGAVKESNQAIAPPSEESKQADVDKQAGDDQGHERSATVTAEKPGGSDKGQSDQDKSSAAAQVTSATGTATSTETDQSKPGVPESPKNDTAQSSDKAFKTWEQIRAVRTIVGYTATPKSTCVEEVKALYLFTGVEPPASFQDPTESEYAESDHSLHFLMSIIGVK